MKKLCLSMGGVQKQKGKSAGTNDGSGCLIGVRKTEGSQSDVTLTRDKPALMNMEVTVSVGPSENGVSKGGKCPSKG